MVIIPADEMPCVNHPANILYNYLTTAELVSTRESQVEKLVLVVVLLVSIPQRLSFLDCVHAFLRSG